MPVSRISSSTARRSSVVAPTQVKCAIASSPSSCLMRLTIAIVRSRVEPPAPYVTDTNDGSSCLSSCAARQRFSMPSSVFGGKNSNEKKGFRSSRISSIRMPEGYARAPVLLLGRDDVEVGGELRLAVQRVLHIHRVVLAVGAEQTEEYGGPADAAELALLLEVLGEPELVADQLVVHALGLRDAVHEHAVGRLRATREVDGPALAGLHPPESRTRRRAS